MKKAIITFITGCMISAGVSASPSYVFRYNMPGVNASEEGVISEESRKTAWEEFLDDNQSKFYKPRDDSFNQIVMTGQITAFPKESYPLSEISGSIAFFKSNVTNVDPFNSLQIVHGSLGFNDSNLSDIDGFRNIKQVDDYITVSRNKLKNINGFSSLSQAGSYINFSENQIENINGLRSLVRVEGFLRGYGNKIQNLDGLARLEYVGDYIEFQDNNLNNINGLRNLKYVGGRIDLLSNYALKDISALSNIEYIGGTLKVDKTIKTRDGFKGIDGDSWLCQPEQSGRFDSSHATQKDLCV